MMSENILPNERVLNCDKCKRKFIQKWVSARKSWSKINEIAYWTGNKKWDGKEYLCRSCLKDWFDNNRKEFNQLVNPEKRRLFLSYKGHGTFDKQDIV